MKQKVRKKKNGNPQWTQCLSSRRLTPPPREHQRPRLHARPLPRDLLPCPSQGSSLILTKNGPEPG